MALVSVVPLASKLWLPRSWISSTHHELKPLRRTIPTRGMCTQRKSVTTTVTDDGVQRRIADHHSNLWDDDFIQSLSTPYETPSYRERSDKLIEEVKDMFKSMSLDGGELFSPFNDLLQRLWVVDSLQRLGIDSHFKNEIKSALDYVYSYWSVKGIGCGRDSVTTDLNSTALGFRILRLQGYTVSSDVLEHFKNHKGQFICSTIQTEGDIRSVLNLFRASLIAFPGEKVMEEAEIFSTMYLKEALQKIPVSSLSRDIEHVLEYGWQTNLPRLEARNYMDIFPHDTLYETPYINKEKLVELAKLEFNIFHSLQQKELQCLSRWWKDSGSPQITFSRHRHVEYYTLASCITLEPQHSEFRLGFAKICHLITLLDDIYDTFGTIEELEVFTTAIKRWDPSSIECLPEYMKVVYIAVYNTVKELAREAEKSQGRDTLNYARQAWEAHIDSYLKEAKWISSGYLPTYEEYLDNGKVSFGYRTAILQPMLTLSDPLPHHILQEIDFPAKFTDLSSAILRLKGDTVCYEADRARGEEASAISCYMKENRGTTEEDALNHINATVNNLFKELNWELLKPDGNVPINCKKLAFDSTRVFLHGYKYRDAFSVASKELKNLVMRTVLEPVHL